MIRNRKVFLARTFCALVSWGAALAQAPQGSILEIDIENAVQYVKDVSDPSEFATDPNVTTPSVPRGLSENVQIADIVAVNGQPAKGTFVERAQVSTCGQLPIRGSPLPTPIGMRLSRSPLKS